MDLVLAFDDNFSILLDLLGFTQGVTLGILFLALHVKRKKDTLLLGLFLIFLSLQSLWPFISDTEFGSTNPELFLFPINFSWLLFPLFFVYSHGICIFSSNKAPYWILYPGLLSLIAQIVIYFQPYLAKVAIAQSSWYDILFTYMGILYSLCIVIWNLTVCNEHKIEAGNVFSKMESKNLQWIVYFLVYGIINSILIIVFHYLDSVESVYKIVFSILDIIAIFWVAFYGLTQEKIQPDTSNKNNENSKPEKPQSQELLKAELENIMLEIDNHMISSEQFTYPDLTVMDLANELNLQPRSISTAVNKVRNQNFNTYINDQRISRAKLMLQSDEHRHLSIEGIGTEAGFHSRSAFYAAFKKRTGTTPSRFKEGVAV